MHRTYSPAYVAEEMNVSTTTLRRYEEQGLIPDVPRTTGNHRYYKSVHVQAFIAIRSLLSGYDIPVVYEAMRSIKKGDINQALWLLNHQLYQMQAEKQRVEEMLAMIKNVDFAKSRNGKITNRMTIGKAAELAGVNSSAIRHWEKEGLIHSERDQENGYRMFTVSELRKILVISSLRKTIYYIENMKDLLNDLDRQNYSKIDRSYQLALQNLNHQLTRKYEAIAELMKYIELLKKDIPQMSG
ncbi:MerR family DNA-binding transcriptional regulator [Paenibacillus allorhizosphaerae]|uniref:HTH merR-type domain-containing protein n=1 Tax=Paenibacillus allorhizosphaerae TaxID=2849866 RepID=A0ABM8VHM9_9BACL|nr:MerR family DNA-binding transcriptional regulator [Paenibacillus allorhizosphaerae]CAG7642516.1 hypothetical protein PAECIP111802_02869 [Paenibacillus allorhizosphaerae]